ncbi:MAG: DnaA/Hda family protein [Methylocystis sp.]|nr:DnaA/Hda family protein [Methylocystis sp.]
MGKDEASPRQLPLELPTTPRYGREDFLEANCNRAALAMIERWPDWPDRALLLVGPPGSGKSHLCAIFAARASALEARGETLPSLDALDAEAPRTVVVDNIDDVKDETKLFHLFNFVVEHDAYLLMSARRLPSADCVRLPDLLSRLRRAPLVEIGAPDDALIRAVLEKLFRDRQLIVERPALDYIALRLERSLGAARAVVEALDRAALAQGRPVTRGLAAEVMESFSHD